jgi:hypothetical protein
MEPIREDDLKRVVFAGGELVDFTAETFHYAEAKFNFRSTQDLIRVVMHCTDAKGWSPDRLAKFFVEERNFPICGYSYYVCKDHIYHMVGDSIITYHAKGYNTNSIGFAIDSEPDMDIPLHIPLDLGIYWNAVGLSAYLMLRYQIIKLVGHRELWGTGWFLDGHKSRELVKTCPGMNIDLDQFRKDVTVEIQKTINTVLGKGTLLEDGILGPITQSTIQSFRVA